MRFNSKISVRVWSSKQYYSVEVKVSVRERLRLSDIYEIAFGEVEVASCFLFVVI